MKQINPLYLALLLIMFFAVVVFTLQSTKAAVVQAGMELKDRQKMAERTVTLKEVWDDHTKQRKTLQRLLKSAPLRESGIVQQELQGMVKVTAESLDARRLAYLINKLLNGTYVIKSMTIRHLDGESVSLEVEIVL